MPVATLVGTPDPENDIFQRVAALEQTLAGELQRLIRAVGQQNVQTLTTSAYEEGHT